MIRFQMLGEIGLQSRDGSPIDPLLRQPKRLALLAYLASPVAGTWHRRDTVLGLFWPEQDTAHARTSLRNALYVLRQTLGHETIRTRGDEEVCVDPSVLETDVAELWEALRNGRAAEALELFRGDLLSGLFPPDSDGFQRWVEAERTRLRLEVAKVGVEWARKLESEGRIDDAVGVARRVLTIHPDDEPAVRRLMVLHRARGDRAGALAAFEEYRARLAREFEAEPDPETTSLAEEMRAPGEPTALRPGSAIAPGQGVVGSGPSLAVHAGLARGRRASDGPRPGRWKAVAFAAGVLAVAALGWRVQWRPDTLVIGNSSPVTIEEGLQIEPAISPNGRMVAYAKGNPQRMRIYIQRLEGGEPWTLSGDSNSVELLPRWSPDNDALVFLSRNNAYASSAVGGTPRIVAIGGEGEAAVRSASWSPNGDSLLIVRNDSLLVRPLEGPGGRFLGRGTQLHSCVWSPDNRWIACTSGNWIAFQPGTLFGNQAPSALVLFPATGGDPIALTDSEKAHHSPAWSADGKSLWFLSNRDGAWGEAYEIEISENGRAQGPARRMGLQAEFISLARNRIAYSVYSRRANAWSIPIGLPRVATLSDAVQVTSGNQLVEVLHASSDGRWLVYDSDLRGNADIYRLPTAGGSPERLTNDPRPEYTGDLSPDNGEVVYHLWKEGRRRLFITNLESGRTEESIPVPGDQGSARWSPAGDTIVAWEHGSEPGSIFLVHRDSTGQWSDAQWRLADAQLPVWSPDGKSIAFLRAAGSIELIPADSGASRVLYAPRQGSDDPIITFLEWDRGRDEIWALGHDTAGTGGIWGVSLRTGRARLLATLRNDAGRVNGPSLTTDDTRFYFTLDERLSNIRWAELIRK